MKKNLILHFPLLKVRAFNIENFYLSLEFTERKVLIDAIFSVNIREKK